MTPLTWKPNRNQPISYAEIAPYLWLHANTNTGQWWISKSADSSRCGEYCITYGLARPIREQEVLDAVVQSARAELHRIADSLIIPRERA